MTHLLIQADARRIPLADRSVDLVLGSPPYCDARTYGIGAQRDAREWVTWMLDVTTEALRVARNCVIWVAAGVTRNRTYWPACEGLMWEWFLRHGHSNVFQDGIELPGEAGSSYRPCYWRRHGIPGSGQSDWFRHDVEYCMCFKHQGELNWSENTAMGSPPKFVPGGAMSHRDRDGLRKNVKRSGKANGRVAQKMYARNPDGSRDNLRTEVYIPPEIANPGNLIDTGATGGGRLGHALAHENEAPFPEDIPEWFIRSLCKPDGIVLDPFSGSGTTVSVAARLGRIGIGGDLRPSQARIARQRLERPHQPLTKHREQAMPLFANMEDTP